MITPIMPTYARTEFGFERGEGVYLHATDGRRFLDFSSGIAVNALGHCHPHLVKILTEQAGRLWHTSNLFQIPHQQRLAERLVPFGERPGNLRCRCPTRSAAKDIGYRARWWAC